MLRSASKVVLPLAALLAVGLACQPRPSDLVAVVYEFSQPWPERRVIDPLPGATLAVLGDDDSLWLYDPVSLAVTAKVPVGGNPIEKDGASRLVASADGRYWFVALTGAGLEPSGHAEHGDVSAAQGYSTAPGQIVKVRASDGVVVARLDVGPNPADVVASPDGTLLFVTHYDLRRILERVSPDQWRSPVTVIDAAAFVVKQVVPTCIAPLGAAFSSGKSQLLVACWGEDSLAKVEPEGEGFKVTRIPIGPNARMTRPTTTPGVNPLAPPAYGPAAVTLDPDGRTVWISCQSSHELRAFDLVSGAVDSSRTIDTVGPVGFGSTQGTRSFFARTALNHDEHLVVVGSAGSSLIDWALPSSCGQATAAFANAPGSEDAVVVCAGRDSDPARLLRVNLASGAVRASALMPAGLSGSTLLLFPPPPLQ